MDSAHCGRRRPDRAHDWTFLFGPGFCVGIGNGIILGCLMWKSGLVPRGMAMLGLIAGFKTPPAVRADDGQPSTRAAVATTG